ncbi:MAG: ferritin-like domain-containing protein, partial [Stellaceae bacterium]
QPYDRRRCARAYAGGTYALYRARHVTRGVALIFKVLGLAPKGRLARVTSRLAWALMRRRAARLAATAS